VELTQPQESSTHKLAAIFPFTELCLLTVDGIPLRCKVDTEDLPKIFAVSNLWRPTYDKKVGSYYVKGNGKYLHRIVMDAPAGMKVDHINHDTLDNRKSHLCIKSHAENIRNSRRRLGVSGVRGVYRAAKSNKSKPWKAQVGFNGRDIFLGDFPTIELAARAVEDFHVEHGLQICHATKAKAAGAQ